MQKFIFKLVQGKQLQSGWIMQYLCQLGSINTANLSDISEYLGNKNGLRHLRK